GELRARELVEEALRRIDELDGRLNAFTVVDAERALAAADAVRPGDERPFAGVPTAIKDLAALAGLPAAHGSELFGDWTPDYDDHVVRRIKDAGFVIVGKTQTPELGILPVTEPRRFGPARNPWDPERTPGGSSGGAGAAVAAGMLPVAHGSDGGGSIRIPAACCGLVGLKPARGRISRGPRAGDSFLATDGMLCRTVADAARTLDALAGYEPGDATWAPPPTEPFADAVRREPGRLRVALVTEPPLPAEVDPVAIAAVRIAAERLESLGHAVEEAAPPWAGWSDLPQLFTTVFTTAIASGVLLGARVTGREPSPELVEPLTWELFERVSAVDAPHYQAALSQLQARARAVVEWALRYDFVLTPALAQRPLRIGELDPCGDAPLKAFAASGRFTPFTSVFNVTGQPAVSLPVEIAPDGLPVAVQLSGRPAGEGGLLALAAQLEQALGFDARPRPLEAR
ncbi:MAG: amidase, partial [Thermoleophilaceae bacterium]|nr:amidase [Thermoleophilaceae bacterium]